MEDKDKTRELFIRQYNYFQYLFEQEQKRAASIVNGAKIYIAFLIFILGSIFLKVITPDKILILFSTTYISFVIKLIGIILVLLTALSLTISVIFTILVLKVWFYERLCDPIERFQETLIMKDEIEVLSKSISDFAVAISRNNQINNKRSEYLTHGLNYLLAGTFLSIITLFFLNFN